MWISLEIDRRLREYIITQMLNFLKFLLVVNDIDYPDITNYADICDIERDKLIRIGYPIPNYNYLWDVIFTLLNIDWSYTQIFSAYCRSNEIKTKHDFYVKMSAELESWIDTIYKLNDIVIMAIGMAQKFDIWTIFDIYARITFTDVITDFYSDALDILKDNNFENIDPNSYEIRPIEQIQTKYDDRLQQVFYEYIMRAFRTENYWAGTPISICESLSRILSQRFNINISIQPNDTEINIKMDNDDQIINYLESKIPQYPDEIKSHLIIISTINKFIPRCNDIFLIKFAKMAELAHYNLNNLPIGPIIFGYGSTPLVDIPLEEIPEYYARLTQSYNNTKAASR